MGQARRNNFGDGCEVASQSFPEEGIFGPFPDRACLARKDCLRERHDSGPFSENGTAATNKKLQIHNKVKKKKNFYALFLTF